jgi:ubiquinol-cytochrome c reductase iron-sulfur subunit
VSHTEAPQGTRRDFIYYATASAGAVVAGAAVWPLINQMNPSADVLALSSIRVDVAGVTPGTQITVLWQGQPVFIRARTAEEIAAAQEGDAQVAEMIDPYANNANLPEETPATDANRVLAAFEGDTSPPGTWLVQMGVCTHLGCVPLGQAGDFDAWFCPCHGSHYDTSGRIRRGPAPRNLPIPVAAFVDLTTIQLG